MIYTKKIKYLHRKYDYVDQEYTLGQIMDSAMEPGSRDGAPEGSGRQRRSVPAHRFLARHPKSSPLPTPSGPVKLRLFREQICIEDAMRRRHRRPCIWGTTGCDSSCKLWRVNVGGCLGTVVDLYGSWRGLGDSLQFPGFLGARFCDVYGASGEYHK